MQAAINLGLARVPTAVEQLTAGKIPNYVGMEVFVEDAAVLNATLVKEEAARITGAQEAFRMFKKQLAHCCMDAAALSTGKAVGAQLWEADDRTAVAKMTKDYAAW